jgi:hypothetical protein
MYILQIMFTALKIDSKKQELGPEISLCYFWWQGGDMYVEGTVYTPHCLRILTNLKLNLRCL